MRLLRIIFNVQYIVFSASLPGLYNEPDRPGIIRVNKTAKN